MSAIRRVPVLLRACPRSGLNVARVVPAIHATKTVLKSARYLSTVTQTTHILRSAVPTSVRSVLARAYSSDAFPPHTKINMPALSPTMTAGNIGTWRKQIGDEIVPGDVLVEIETDKAQMDFECQDEGYLAKIFIESGAKDVSINTPIAIMVENKEDVEKFKDYVLEDSSAPAAAAESKPEEPKAQEKPAAAAPTSSAPAASAPSTDRIFASPIAKKLAKEGSIELSQIQGSGPNGRILKADVEGFVPAAAPQAADAAVATGNYSDIPVSNMRRVIAGRLSESKQTIPHYYLSSEVNMDKVLKLREVLNSQANDQYKLSVNDFVVKASAAALKDVPEVNSAWYGDFIRQFKSADISIATATPSGLITPIVQGADTRGLVSISKTVKELATKARNNELKPQEYQGGSFTISNLGMFGIDSFTAIINPPQSCILAVGATQKKVIPDAGKESGFAVGNVMNVTLSCDHRVVDGAVGAQWLKSFKGYLENPLKLLL
ncbi:pyruvate dehydrogenase [Basidiobolus meristosporus CBS 931.73]|uniref:Acetyltransferase component of pyruvate dehydrogenase complex n=1 Tax=Basidiobolus meristosporus CBS 931.73 TaxID=1314790 RepID=A0A1Y1XYH3_9FUNG|nr:pyruvate dehydrogenase [Basidiobolus meristosporus CBS 931.73]|eukprot:ORX90789.1 pyruvate dehydrogenase [Basidiobolus meristosporus CBS 931.73]